MGVCECCWMNSVGHQQVDHHISGTGPMERRFLCFKSHPYANILGRGRVLRMRVDQENPERVSIITGYHLSVRDTN